MPTEVDAQVFQDARISGHVTRGMEQLLEMEGVSATDLLSHTGLPPVLLDETEDDISLRQFVALLEGASEFCGDSRFGMHYGDVFALHDLGILGLAIMGARSIGDGLRMLSEYFAALQEQSVVRYSVEDDTVRVVYQILDPTIWPRAQDAEFSLSAIVNLVLGMQASHDRCAALVEFEHSQNSTVNDYHRNFRAPVLFNMPANAIEFPVALLDAPILCDGSEDLALPETDLKSLCRQKADSMGFAASIRMAIVERLSDGGLRAEDLASDFGMSVRTFHRKMDACGVSLRDVVKTVRLEMAKNYLGHDRISVTDTAFKLGYSDVSAFDRAFKTWTGVAPGVFRHRSYRDD